MRHADLRRRWRASLRWLLMVVLSQPALALAAPAGGPLLAQNDDTTRPARPASTESGTTVLYPDIGEPYRSIFSQIVEGIQQRSRGRVFSQKLGAATTSQEVLDELRRNDTRVLIALGRNGLRMADTLNSGLPVVAGAVLHTSENDAATVQLHSLAPSPALLFTRLKQIAPATRRVLTVFNAAQNGWMMKLAVDAARQQGLELVRYEAADAKAAARTFQEIFAEAERGRDAVWLVQDSVAVDDTVVLPYVLEEGWNRSIPVFSSSLAHVRRGALFALYPDNLELGRRLGSAAQVAAGSGTARGLLPLQDTLLAVNVRSANHLGLRVNTTELGVSLVFPTP